MPPHLPTVRRCALLHACQCAAPTPHYLRRCTGSCCRAVWSVPALPLATACAVLAATAGALQSGTCADTARGQGGAAWRIVVGQEGRGMVQSDCVERQLCNPFARRPSCLVGATSRCCARCKARAQRARPCCRSAHGTLPCSCAFSRRKRRRHSRRCPAAAAAQTRSWSCFSAT